MISTNKSTVSRWIWTNESAPLEGGVFVNLLSCSHITITGYEHDDPRACLEKWNDVVDVMDQVCSRLGEDKCLRVKYEELVLHPRREIAAVLRFLDIPWNNSVLSHHKMINQPGGVRVSNMERSSDQIIQPVHTKALTEWVGTLVEVACGSYREDLLVIRNQIPERQFWRERFPL